MFRCIVVVSLVLVAYSFVPVVESRIVGGTAVQPGEYPYFVEMGGCGGALIAPDVVLFAAHCGDRQNYQVIVGAYKSKTLDGGWARARVCEEWVPDPTYRTTSRGVPENDFALCKLDAPVEWDEDENTTTLELNFDDDALTAGDELVVMGVGRTSFAGPSHEYLHDVTVPVVDTTDCNVGHEGKVTEAMFCAGHLGTGGKDACKGDSGGPIVRRQRRADGTIVDTHVGVVSWGSDCADPQRMGVYAKTSHRAAWIRSIVCDRFRSPSKLCGNDQNAVVPTPQPNKPCLEDDEDELIVTVTTDGYARETSWSLWDHDGTEVFARHYLVNYHENTHTLCLPKNTRNHCGYTWYLSDHNADGICWQGTCGSYSLAVNGITVAEDTAPDFASIVTHELCTGPPPPTSSPTPTPDPTCGGKEHLRYHLELQTDQYGSETILETHLLDASGDREHSVAKHEGFASHSKFLLPASSDPTICLEAGRCYEFEIIDTYGDGFDESSGSTGGSVTGYLGSAEVFAVSGNFGADETKTFCTEKPPSLPSNKESLGPDSVLESQPCTDDPDFLMKHRKKMKPCHKFVRGRKLKGIAKKCQRKVQGRPVHESCPQSCGKKAGVGRCSHLYTPKSQRKKQQRNPEKIEI